MILEMGSKPVFVDTNIGTRIVFPVSPDITENEFKGELERFHVHCCPEVGNITVERIMVKKGSRHYQLSESMPLKYLFGGSNASWFLHAKIIVNRRHSSETESLNSISANDVKPPVNFICSLPCKKRKRKRKKRCKSESVGTLTNTALLQRKRKRIKRCKSRNVSSPTTTAEINCSQERDSKSESVGTLTTTALLQRKGKRIKRCKSQNVSSPTTTAEINCSQERDSRLVTETLNENISEPMSVSGIISKYFLDCDEVASDPWSNKKLPNYMPGFASPVTAPSFRVSRSLQDNKPGSTLGLKRKESEVGRRLLHASASLGLFPNNKQFATSLSKFSNRKSCISKSTAAMRSLVFEIP